MYTTCVCVCGYVYTCHVRRLTFSDPVYDGGVDIVADCLPFLLCLLYVIYHYYTYAYILFCFKNNFLSINKKNKTFWFLLLVIFSMSLKMITVMVILDTHTPNDRYYYTPIRLFHSVNDLYKVVT